jgi:lysophospholipase L1-like esterase
MNPNSNAIRILCFGDSNVWGRSGASVDRYTEDVRWTALVQKQLGSGYEIIEEGLRSRTTDLDDGDDEQFPHRRNGEHYFRPCLESHGPLDLIILWLGTNDFKSKFSREPVGVAAGMAKLLAMAKTNSFNRQKEPTKILLVSPPLIREEVLKTDSQFIGGGVKSQQLGSYLQTLAQQENVVFLDLAPLVTTGDYDGVHLEPEQHVKLAPYFVQKIQQLCPPY